MNLNSIRDFYRALRIEVFNVATQPLNSDTDAHERNKLIFKEFVQSLSNSADLRHFNSTSPEARTMLWHHLWTKNRYAGIRANTASKEIKHIEPLFDNYKWFNDEGWNLESKGQQVIQAGSLVNDFLNRTGEFAGKQTVGNIPKLNKIVRVARSFDQFFLTNPSSPAIDFITQGKNIDDIWGIHRELQNNGYVGDLTTLHFMMDVGFQVIKPDLVISRLFLDWGWLHLATDLPDDITRMDLVGRGNYGTTYLYTKPKIYKPIIDLSREIVAGLDSNDLRDDIGWVSKNPIREFDIFVVKAGQQPEEHFGIVRRLYA